jgi:hypothetical protein
MRGPDEGAPRHAPGPEVHGAAPADTQPGLRVPQYGGMPPAASAWVMHAVGPAVMHFRPIAHLARLHMFI